MWIVEALPIQWLKAAEIYEFHCHAWSCLFA